MTESSFGSSGTNIIMTFIADQFIKSLRSRVRVLNLVKSVGDSLSNGGETVNVPLAPTISSNLLTDGNAVTLDDTSGTSKAITLNKHRYCAYGETLIALAKTGNTSAVQMELESRMSGLFNDIEADILTVANAGFTTNTVGSYNSAITEANIVSGIGKLIAARVPQDKPLVGLVAETANAWQALAQISNFASGTYRGLASPSPVIATDNYGSMVPFHGAFWSQTTSVYRSGTSVDNVVFHPDAICVAMRTLPVVAGPGVEMANFVDSESKVAFQICRSWNKDRLAFETVIHVLYGYGVGRESWGLLFKS